MSVPRFTVDRAVVSLGPRAGRVTGWVVFDRGERITIPYANYAEAEEHRKNIHRYYLRWGW